ncbi:DUF2635 domain-containing protein [Mannheimia haemolytica]|uniref:DUF2635 domain-containing protein n=1 Tax=Mannheimia haemolytica TaxID=75985 RepID=UPI0001BCF71E|nr:DUF2635 domain-containing protein [Mannheimia haemolytica]EEY13310.1 hypothetical protein COK_0543 [Mannheimia haemolytica serotype A2 str. BOVINE]EPZ00489.1 hypothetical protein L278_00890 [Mannheimia haemolytica D35]MDW0617367.1 DUF2635 domain-containing protein [Mannheimia haemolytica]MDW0723589.1 DUF2635 domain-containing protein [Mannheimia haemolytica]MDW0736620.1 DUF2635 domain-containing protein [Mannheimia haemolytica]
MPTFKIKPKAGLIIRDPNTFEPLSEKGEEKPKSGYWLKHLKNGDVELVEAKPNERKTKSEKA